MKQVILLFVILWPVNTVLAQNSISGIVSDQDGMPLPGASIYIPELQKGTVTGGDGTYVLRDLPGGPLRIQFSFIGFATTTETVFPVGSGSPLNVTLRYKAVEAEEIVISTGYSTTQHENVIKVEKLKLTPLALAGTPNFVEVLTRVPGVDMISKGSGVSKPVIRGLSMNDVLVLDNGVRYENYQYSDHHPLGIDEFGIEEVEVLKGPASLLYGSDAIGGVINFIKEKPAPMGSIAGDYNMQLHSNTLGLTQNLGIRGASKDFFGGIRFGQKTNADFLQGGGAFAPNTRFNEVSFKSNAGYTGKSGAFKLFYDYNRQRLGLAEEEAFGQIPSRGRPTDIFYQELNTHLVSSQNRLYAGKFKFTLNAAYQNTELSHIGQPDEYEIQMNLATFTYDAKMQLPSGTRSEYILGIQGMDQANTNVNDRETILLPDATTRNVGFFGLGQHLFFNKLKLQAGLRYDKNSISTSPVGSVSDSVAYRPSLERTYGSFSGSAGATLHLTGKLLFRTNLAAAYRTPTLSELTSNGPHELRYEVGDADLVPENAYELDGSMHFHGDNLTMDVAGFYNLVDHYIFINPTGDTTVNGLEMFRYRQANSFLYGGEAGFHVHPKPIEWLHLETTLSSVIGKMKDGGYLPFIPAHKVHAELRVEQENLHGLHQAYFSIRSLTAFRQDRVAAEETATNGYTLIDLGAGATLVAKDQSFILGIGVSNLFDVQYVDHLSTLKESHLFNPGRNISFTLKIPFEI